MKIIPLQEGNYVVNSEKEFKLINEFPLDSGLKMAIQPFLIITQHDYILLDLGLGFNKNGKPFIHHLLQTHNIVPEQITKVLISHFHKDHIEGIGYFVGDNFIQNFPNAIIYMQERELDFALTQQHPSYNLDILNQFKLFPNVEFLEDDKGEITNEIFYEVSGGHSPFHQVFWIKENNGITFYGADDLPQEAYLKMHVAYKTDYNGKRAMESRKKWEQEAKEGHWKVLLYHDMKKPVLEF
ncbi:MBL fold metallo-hydrolase [Flavobacterium sp. CSZ]|uniref:MBL fold metallo-hydrolase n=1 Tax=Flavobacterium sp. CSZ TaxID=2783791 RepID=UPI00188C072B|nr:MBL fold metallo-hydrolase [Flavobacterium sp. CSZ]MBF4484910.1 MBL fold metallo-hydrolase [Flavobacterium sp. CSZ]